MSKSPHIILNYYINKLEPQSDLIKHGFKMLGSESQKHGALVVISKLASHKVTVLTSFFLK